MYAVEYFYQEIAKLLLNHSPDSFEDVGQCPNFCEIVVRYPTRAHSSILVAEKARILIKDIEEVRASKLHASLRELTDYTEAVRIAHISAGELNGYAILVLVTQYFQRCQRLFIEYKHLI